MPSYKLTYFDIRGRAEISRLLFAYAGQKYEDIRVEQQNWPAMKPSTPFGQLPVLEVDGKQIGQSTAIATYLAREFGLYGKTNIEHCQIDQIGCLVQDYISAVSKFFYEKDEAKKAELMKKHNEEVLPRFLGMFEGLLKKNVTEKYFVGNSFTLADMFAFDLIWNINNSHPNVLDNFPTLNAHLIMVGNLPQIKSYVEKRKPTPM